MKLPYLNPQLVGAINRFGFRLLLELAGDTPTKNLLISPASLSAALSMTYNGAAGETARAMADVLSLEGLSLDEINRAHAALRAELVSSDPQVILAIANSLWTRGEFLTDFIQRNHAFYGAELGRLESVEIINAWVSQQTQGKITQIITRIGPLDILLLLNALYFKGPWRSQFDTAATRQGVFHLSSGDERPCPMMSRSGEYRYCEGSDFQAISLPYGTGRFSFYIFLPAEKDGLGAFLGGLTDDRWDDWMTEFWERPGEITLPRFKATYDIILNDTLMALGMGDAFDPSRADFSAMCPIPPMPGVYISLVRHKTFVEVNEEGTEAAAVTLVKVLAKGPPPPPPFRMVVDRPFFCAIRDNDTGVLLFAGLVVEPEPAQVADGEGLTQILTRKHG